MSASSLRVLGLTIASAWFVAGCGQAKKVDVGGACMLNSDCNQSLVCTMGKCHDACHTSTDCPAGQSCITASEQTKVCQLSVEAHCLYASDCQPPLICAVDQRCRNPCQTDVDCPTGQTCTTSRTCAEKNQVDSNKNLFVPDGGVRASAAEGGVSASGGASGGDASAVCPVGGEGCSCYGNGTCSTGLTCASHLCVRLDAGATVNGGGIKAAGGTTSGGATMAAGGATGTGGLGGTSSAGGGTSCPAGSETCACYLNDTCDPGLICASHLCVVPPSGGTGGTTGGNVNTGGITTTGGIGPDASVGSTRDSAADAPSKDAPPIVWLEAGPGIDTSAGGSDACLAGTEGCACFPNDTCNAGLTCASHLCVHFATGGTSGAGGTAGAGGTVSTGGTTGGTTPTGGTTSTGGSTFSTPDAGVDSPVTPDATPTPNQTVALFHFDGTQGSTLITDSSGTGKVAAITGNPVISTAQSRFGGASLYVDGTSSVRTNYVLSSGSDFVMEGDFTLDFWIFPISYPGTWGSLVILGDCDHNQPIGPSWNSGGSKWHFNPYYYSGANIDAPAPLTWHHVAVTRSGLTYRAFVDGSQVYTNTSSTFSYTYGTLWVTGCGSAGDNGDLKGYIDELRVVKGAAVWTSNFTPPTAPYASPDISPPDAGAPDAAPPTRDATDAIPMAQNLMLWLNAGTITGLADGANVAKWSDGSGNGKDVSPAGVPPTYRVNQMNGHPIVRFDGNDDELSTAGNFGLSGDPSFTVTLVAKISSSNSPSTSPMFWSFDDLSQARTGACLQWRNGTVGVDTGFFNLVYPPANSFAAYADVPSIVTIRRAPGQIGQTTEFFFDGTKQSVSGVSATPTMIDGLFYVGSWRGQRSIMDIAELLAYGIALTDADRAALECSLGTKYNIAVAGCNY